MGDVGDKVLAQRLQAPQVGDIVQHDEGADNPPLRILQHRTVGLEGTLLAAHLQQHIPLYRVIVAQRLGHEALQVGLAHRLLDRPPLGGPLAHPDQLGGSAVETENPLLAVHRQHPFDHAAQHRLLFVALA